MRFDFSVNLTSARDALGRATPNANHTLALQVKKDTEKFTPALTGSMIDRTVVYEDYIVYPGPYAQYLYYGKLMVDPATGSPWASRGASKILTNRNLVFQKSMSPEPQAHWFEVSKALNMDRWNEIYAKAVDRELG